MSQATYAEDVRVLIPADEIAHRRQQLAEEITRDYAGEELVLVCILKGSLVFFADLAREVRLPLRFDCIDVSSYRSGTESSGNVELRADLSEDITGKHVLLVEDIVDTGRTIDFLMRLLSLRKPASLKVAALLDKPSRREVEVDVAYRGFEIPNEFVVGYGLDFNQMYRSLPYIGVIENETPS